MSIREPTSTLWACCCTSCSRDVCPFDRQELHQKGIIELTRLLREKDPPRPSIRITQLGPASAEVAACRRIDPNKLAGRLRGDLDWITMKALEKDRTRRYGSVSDLAADLRRHLNNQPVLASPPSTWYRAGKFVRRHRVGVSAATTLIAMLVAFAATTGIQARRIALERDRANREAEIAKAVNDFLQNDLLAQAGASSQARPNTKPDPDLKVRTALDRAAAGIEGKFAAQPLVEASIRHTIGKTYKDLACTRKRRSTWREPRPAPSGAWRRGCQPRDGHERPGRRAHEGSEVRRGRSTACTLTAGCPPDAR